MASELAIRYVLQLAFRNEMRLVKRAPNHINKHPIYIKALTSNTLHHALVVRAIVQPKQETREQFINFVVATIYKNGCFDALQIPSASTESFFTSPMVHNLQVTGFAHMMNQLRNK